MQEVCCFVSNCQLWGRCRQLAESICPFLWCKHAVGDTTSTLMKSHESLAVGVLRQVSRNTCLKGGMRVPVDLGGSVGFPHQWWMCE